MDTHNALHTAASARNLGPLFDGIDGALFSLSTIVVGARLFTRTWITYNLGWDDAMMFLTQALTCVGKAFIATEVSYGLGQHRSDLSIQNYRNFLRYYYFDTAQFFIALATCKISICLFLLRLSQFNKLRRVLWSLIIFLVISHLIFTLLVILQCRPLNKVWDLGTPGKCIPLPIVARILVAQGVASFLTDFICAAFPIVLLRNLSIPRRSKIALCALMGLGIITGIIAIARTATSYEITSTDLSWAALPTSFTRIFEINIGNIGACVPVLRPFIRWVQAKWTGRDPHHLLNRKSSSSETDKKRFRRQWWGSRPGRGSGDGYTGHADGEQGTERVLPPGVVMVRATGPGETVSMTETERPESIGLPLQGIRRGDEDDYTPEMPDIRDSEYFQSHGKPLRGGWDTKDVV